MSELEAESLPCLIRAAVPPHIHKKEYFLEKKETNQFTEILRWKRIARLLPEDQVLFLLIKPN